MRDAHWEGVLRYDTHGHLHYHSKRPASTASDGEEEISILTRIGSQILARGHNYFDL